MKQLKIKIITLSLQQLADIFENIEDSYVDGEQIKHAGIWATKCYNHPEYGDIILFSGDQDGGLMVHL